MNNNNNNNIDNNGGGHKKKKKKDQQQQQQTQKQPLVKRTRKGEKFSDPQDVNFHSPDFDFYLFAQQSPEHLLRLRSVPGLALPSGCQQRRQGGMEAAAAAAEEQQQSEQLLRSFEPECPSEARLEAMMVNPEVQVVAATTQTQKTSSSSLPSTTEQGEMQHQQCDDGGKEDGDEQQEDEDEGEMHVWEVHYRSHKNQSYPIKNYICKAFPSLLDLAPHPFLPREGKGKAEEEQEDDGDDNDSEVKQHKRGNNLARPLHREKRGDDNNNDTDRNKSGRATKEEDAHVHLVPVAVGDGGGGGGGVVMECGCGNGSAILPIIRLLPNTLFVLFDVSAFALDILIKHPVALEHTRHARHTLSYPPPPTSSSELTTQSEGQEEQAQGETSRNFRLHALFRSCGGIVGFAHDITAPGEIPVAKHVEERIALMSRNESGTDNDNEASIKTGEDIERKEAGGAVALTTTALKTATETVSSPRRRLNPAGGGGTLEAAAKGTTTTSLLHQCDRILLVFVLCAVPVERMLHVLCNLRQFLKPGGSGQLCFRDYGALDHNYFRFLENKNDCDEFLSFRRGDGTRQFFFEKHFTLRLFSAAGFRCKSIAYHCNSMVNRKNGKKMEKVFINAVFTI